ncbi:MAG: type 4a pilus biogenesis protein PilO, partial [Candidatus Omnitrophota bacterium]
MNQLIGFYKGLGKRERILALMFIGAIAGSVYYHSLYKPFLLTARRYKQQAERLETRIHEVESDAPEILAKEERVKGLNKQCALLLDEIQDIEKKLPSKSTTSRLVGELARLAKDLRLDSIRQRIDDGDEYSRIFVEMKFDASYKETVRFIKRVETISPFLNIEEFEIIEPHKAKKRQGVGTSTRVVISSVLGEMPFAD